MGRPREFKPEEIQIVRAMQQQGEPRGDIASVLGCTSSSYAWFLSTGRFGHDLPKSQGRRKNHVERPDDEEKQTLFGCSANEWQERQQQVKDAWDGDERVRRASGKVPGVTDNYSRFKENPGRTNRHPGRNQHADEPTTKRYLPTTADRTTPTHRGRW